MIKHTVLAFSILLFMACQSGNSLNQKMYNAVPEAFDAQKMKVKGRYARNLSYGNFTAEQIKRGATKGSTGLFFPSANKNADLSKKSSFTQKNQNGSKAQVNLLEEYSRKGFSLALNDFIEIDNSTVSHHLYSGIIQLEDAANWQFSIDLNQAGPYNAKNEEGQSIQIQFTDYGCDFLKNQKKVAGYATGVFIKNWTPLADFVWIDTALTNNEQLVLAGLATALLSRQGIDLNEDEEQDDDW